MRRASSPSKEKSIKHSHACSLRMPTLSPIKGSSLTRSRLGSGVAYVLQNQCNSGGKFFSSLVEVEVVSQVTLETENMSPQDAHWNLCKYTAMVSSSSLMEITSSKTLAPLTKSVGNTETLDLRWTFSASQEDGRDSSDDYSHGGI